ncbi:RecQ family ATP-dependent DNA helicase [Tomitella cavernea]|uniref:DNA 3'-5' helicase n=1 Tax=Tomitella cavernea TaxID=1387982 RepID=A0ABP9CXC9_9ACTN
MVSMGTTDLNAPAASTEDHTDGAAGHDSANHDSAAQDNATADNATADARRRAALRSRADELLLDLAGAGATLRDDQWTAIEALVVDRRRALVVQRTGWGKSAVYFIAAKLLREAGRGPTVIVSPLLALMRNQVAAAARAGVRAATINSGNITEWDGIHEQIRAGGVDVLLVSPERLNNPDFRDNVLPHLAHDAGLVVVDEAHCVSDWGHDFRPDYRRIRTLVADLGRDTPVLATTATANDRVVADVATQLGVGADADAVREDSTLVLRGGLDRASLRLSVVHVADSRDRAAWLAQNLGSLPGSGIVYALTVSAAEDLAAVLAEQGHAVAAYTGRTDPAERESLEADLLANRVKCLVATSALGMGFDKPDLGFVVHVGAPSSPISYYQQVGRAGRGTERAEVVLLPGPEDEQIWRYFASVSFPDEQTVRAVIAALSDAPTSTPALESRVDLGRSRLEMVLKVLDVDGAVRRVRGGWVATGHEWVYDAERYEGLARERRAEQQAMLDYERTAQCRMRFLRAQLDDPLLAGETGGCGRCDNCTGAVRDAAVDQAAARTARDRLDRPGVDLAARRQWPTGLPRLGMELKGRIDDGPAVGRALGRLTDLGWGTRLRSLLADPDASAPPWLIDGCVEVLKSWRWEVRPDAVAALHSETRPRLVQSVAQGLAAIGRLDLLSSVSRPPDLPPVTAANSAFRVAQIGEDFAVPQAPAPGSTVLLVTDLVETGWMVTMAARAMRGAGARGVLPLALATRS